MEWCALNGTFKSPYISLKGSLYTRLQEKMFSGHNRAVAHMNSQSLWLHAQSWTHELTVIVTACTRSEQAQARWDPIRKGRPTLNWGDIGNW